VEGGSGVDFLTVYVNGQSLQLLGGSGNSLFSAGSNGTTVTVVDVEHGQVINGVA